MGVPKKARGDPPTKKYKMQPTRNRNNAVALALILHQLSLEIAPALAPILNKENVSPRQANLLRHIAAQRGEVIMTDVARWLSSSTAATTGAVDRLEKLDFLERRQANDDRRKVVVRITKKGLDLLARLDEATVALIDERFGRQIDAARALQQLIAVLSLKVAPGA